MNLAFIVLASGLFILGLSALHHYIKLKDKMKKETLNTVILKNQKKEALVFYSTQQINVALSLARDAMHNSEEFSHFHRIRVKCMCEKHARVPLGNGETILAPEGGTIIQFLLQ